MNFSGSPSRKENILGVETLNCLVCCPFASFSSSPTTMNHTLFGCSIQDDPELHDYAVLISALPHTMDAANKRQIVVRVLLATEHEAQQIVNAAKAERLGKIQQAKEEAENAIAGHRAEMEVEFQKRVAEDTDDLGANMKRLEQETEKRINHLQFEADRVRRDIACMLFKNVTTVRV
ncbi:hypothetical protein ACH5RR_005451 [Cinchona calisaya]|uniref:V-type proton ATPase subunit G n=1 Tax=Cinchona calisaya TaxID=153742 RepID=A0ABD3AL79_9GENT